jgi:surfeit locus 1 family protein
LDVRDNALRAAPSSDRSGNQRKGFSMARPASRFSLIGLLLSLLVLGVCLGLSGWQWQRAEEKRAWLANQQAKAGSAPVSLERARAMADPQHQPVYVSGVLDNDRPILLDNRLYRGRAGYYLLSPLRTDTGDWVLLNRGWLPAAASRQQLPAVPPVSGPVRLQGVVYQPPANALVLKDLPLPENQWPLRVQKVDIAAISARLGVELAPFEIRVAADDPLAGNAMLPRPWQGVAATISPQRHVAYALQWLALGVASVVVFVLAGRRGASHQDQHNT